MGAWGTDAFANDAALDAAPELASEAAVIEALDRFLVAESEQRTLDGLIEPAYAAAEIVALVRGGKEVSWQSEGTTLFTGGEGAPYIPDEVAAFIESDSAFADGVAEAALRVIDSLAADSELEDWNEPDERRAALAATRERLLNPARPWVTVEPGPRERPSPLAEA